jgi:nitroreductase
MIMLHTDTAVLDAITSRRSVRGFTDALVPRETIETILEASARAPSATNTQPWRVHVLTGGAKERLTSAIMAERATGAAEPAPEYPYYSTEMPEPYLSRRRAIGWRLYGLLGIGKGDRAGARAWHDQNYRFFGASVGMIFTLDRRLGLGAYIDLGMFMQNIMTAARGLGLDTCPQAAFAGYHAIIRQQLALPAEDIVICGMALGWEDTNAVANQVVADREPLVNFAVFSQ